MMGNLPGDALFVEKISFIKAVEPDMWKPCIMNLQVKNVKFVAKF